MTARVLWLVKGLGRGGAERLLTLTASRLDRSRFDVEVAYVLPGHDAFVAELEHHGVGTHCLARAGRFSWLPQLRRRLRDGTFDIVHTHSPLPAVAARLLAPRGQALVHTEHNVWDAYHPLTRAANAATYGRNHTVVAVSEGVAGSIRAPGWALGRRPRIEWLHHGVDVASAPRGATARRVAREALGIGEGALVVGTVGNLTPKKDHAGLLAAFELVVSDVPEAMLLLIGSGPLEDALRSDARARGLDRHVQFLGSRDDVATLLPALDVFVLSSRHEGLPIALLEAMSAEVASVSTRVGGVAEVLTDGIDGCLVEPGCPEVLSAALAGLLTDPKQRGRLADAGRRRVERGFSIDRATRRLEELYAEVIDRR